MTDPNSPYDVSPAVRAMLRLLPDIPAVEEAATVHYLRESGLALDAVLLALFDQSDDCIKIIDREGRLAFMNCNGKRAMEIDDFEQVCGRPWDELWPAAMRPTIRLALREAEGGAASRFEGHCPTAKGAARDWEVTVSPVRGHDGAVCAFVSTSRMVGAAGARAA